MSILKHESSLTEGKILLEVEHAMCPVESEAESPEPLPRVHSAVHWKHLLSSSAGFPIQGSEHLLHFPPDV